MRELIKLKEKLCEELKAYGMKGDITAGTLEVVDKLAHTVKNLDKIIESMDYEGTSHGYDPVYDSGIAMRSYRMGGNAYEGNSMRRDAMGRYAAAGGGKLAEAIRDSLYGMSPEAQQDAQRLLHKLEGNM